jgi:hypothetical protein
MTLRNSIKNIHTHTEYFKHTHVQIHMCTYTCTHTSSHTWVPLMMTVCAGRFTPQANVAVDTSTCKAGREGEPQNCEREGVA